MSDADIKIAHAEARELTSLSPSTRCQKMNWKHLSFIWSRAAPVAAFAAYMTLLSYLAVHTWGLRTASTVSVIAVTVVVCLLLLWMALRWEN